MDMVVSTCWLNQPATAAVTTTTKIRQAWIRVSQEHGKNSQKTGLPEIQASNAIGLLLAKPLRGWNNLVRHWIARREKWKQECKRIQLTFSFQLDHVEWCWMYVNKGRAKTHHAQYIERLHHTHAHAPVFRICFVESWIFLRGPFWMILQNSWWERVLQISCLHLWCKKGKTFTVSQSMGSNTSTGSANCVCSSKITCDLWPHKQSLVYHGGHRPQFQLTTQKLRMTQTHRTKSCEFHQENEK